MTEPGSAAGFSDPLAARLAAWVQRSQTLQEEGLPMPVEQVRGVVEHLRARGEAVRAEQALARAERLLDRASDDWKLLRELLRRIEELKDLAAKGGLDLSELDARLGNPREQLKGSRLSEGVIERAMATASKSLAVLNDVLPKYFVVEAQKLGRTIKSAQGRGEDIGEASERFTRFMGALRAGQLRGAATAFLELRRAVTQIPRAPTVPLPPQDEEEEILREARNLARRLNRMKSRARNAQSAARLVTQVKAALAEDRRFSTPEEEIEELWNEVERVTKERVEAQADPAAAKPARPKVPELDPTGIPPELIEAANEPIADPAAPARTPASSRSRRNRT